MSVGAVNKQTGDRIPTAGMPAIDSVLSGSSTNPVQNAIITAALADKQDKTDNNLTTTDKTTTGAINELKSGLTDLFEKGEFIIACVQGRNIFNITTATLISGSFPSSTTDCIMMINNHGSEQNVPNTIEIDGSNQFMINAVSAQNLHVFWVRFN